MALLLLLLSLLLSLLLLTLLLLWASHGISERPYGGHIGKSHATWEGCSMVRYPLARWGSQDQAIPEQANWCRAPNPSASYVNVRMDLGPSLGHLGSPPTPSAIYKEVGAASSSVLYQGQKTANDQHFQETIPFRTQHLISLGCHPTQPPYPCVGHYSPPSPSAVFFCRSESPNNTTPSSSPSWPSRGPFCHCLF